MWFESERVCIYNIDLHYTEACHLFSQFLVTLKWIVTLRTCRNVFFWDLFICTLLSRYIYVTDCMLLREMYMSLLIEHISTYLQSTKYNITKAFTDSSWKPIQKIHSVCAAPHLVFAKQAQYTIETIKNIQIISNLEFKDFRIQSNWRSWISLTLFESTMHFS